MLRTCAVLVGVLLFTSSFTTFSNNAYSEESSLPEWVKNIFVWFGQGVVSESELLGAIEWLIENNVIKIKQVSENSNWREQAAKLLKENQRLEERNKQLYSLWTTEKNLRMGYSADGTEYYGSTASSIVDKGDFYVTYYENPNSIYDTSAKEWIQGEEYFEYQINFLNSFFRLPHDVEIVVEECNEVNAFYDYTTKQIIMCYEFLDSVFTDFVTYYSEEGIEVTDDELSIQNLDVVDFVFYHELGHAMVDIFQLPITGLEENVVDQFAAYFMLLYTEDVGDYEGIFGQDIMYNVGTWFFIQANLGYEHVYWDVHNLDIQRFYNLSCYAYGKDPQYNYDLITEGWLPQERAENCAYEYAVLEDSWSRILSPYFI